MTGGTIDAVKAAQVIAERRPQIVRQLVPPRGDKLPERGLGLGVQLHATHRYTAKGSMADSFAPLLLL